MDANILLLTALGLLPTVETRYAIPVAVGMGYDPVFVFLWAAAITLLLSLALAYGLWIFDTIVRRIPVISDFWAKYVDRARKRAKPYVDKYGAPGLILFVAIPLPGTGIWTGSIVGYIFGIDAKRLTLYTFIGGILANTIAILASLGVFAMI